MTLPDLSEGWICKIAVIHGDPTTRTFSVEPMPAAGKQLLPGER